jgi:hypothetical protein
MEERQTRWHLQTGGRRWWRSAPKMEATWRGAPVGHEVGNNSAMVRSLCKLEWGKKKRRGRGSLSKETCERHTSEKGNEREGVRYGDEGENREPTSVPGKEGRIVQGRGECGAMPRPLEHDSRGSRHRWLPQDTQ